MNIEALPERAAAAPGLARWGRHLNAEVLVEVGTRRWILSVRDGVLRIAAPAPALMPLYIGLRFEEEGCALLSRGRCRLARSDGVLRQGALRVEGNIQPFIAHLFWIKGSSPAAGGRGGMSFEPFVGRYLRLELEGRPIGVCREAGRGVRCAAATPPAGMGGNGGTDERRRSDGPFRCMPSNALDGRPCPEGWQREASRLTTAPMPAWRWRFRGRWGDRPVVLGYSIAADRAGLRRACREVGRCRAAIRPSSRPITTRNGCTTATQGGESAPGVSGLVGPSAPERAVGDAVALMPGGPGVFRGDLHFYKGEGDLRPKLARIDTARCPVALLTGEFDYSCRPEDTRATAAAIAGAEVAIMPGLGHFPMSEDYAALRQHLLPVLRRFAALP